MLAQSLRVSRSAVARTAFRQPATARTFVGTAIRRADLVQEIYLRELKAHKLKPESAAAAEEAVRKWAPPPAPPLPESANANTTSELSAYESQAVEVEGQDAATEGAAAAQAEDWFEEDVAFAEKDAHH